jgi:hypothetical protein
MELKVENKKEVGMTLIPSHIIYRELKVSNGG